MLANIKFKQIEDLKMLRAQEEPEGLQSKFHDEEGKFIPYSTVISTEEQHNALMALRLMNKEDDINDAEKLFNMIKKMNEGN